ncbi:MAG: hypothetical protein H0T53_09060 [Herpetosiphonaceae bacterium]|nr:hypothetical protein [Herpetosiphonaceae bacterium]
MQTLLAVDLGLRTGFALYGDDGRLISYRSQNYGSVPRLRRGAAGVLGDLPELTALVLEGGGVVAEVWESEARRRGLPVFVISAEVWRQRLLYAREQRSGAKAKETADELARRIISWSNAPRPTSLRHDAAEAILVGLWGVLELGWLLAVPPEVRRA